MSFYNIHENILHSDWSRRVQLIVNFGSSAINTKEEGPGNDIDNIIQNGGYPAMES